MNTNKQLLNLQETIIKDLVKENIIELLEKSVDERGLPVFGVIEVENDNGELVLAYKKERQFDAEDYRKAALYQAKLANNHRVLADYYSDELQKRTATDNEQF
jgi:hypothetical protein